MLALVIYCVVFVGCAIIGDILCCIYILCCYILCRAVGYAIIYCVLVVCCAIIYCVVAVGCAIISDILCCILCFSCGLCYYRYWLRFRFQQHWWHSPTSEITALYLVVYKSNFQLLEAVDRGSETQLQVTEN